MLLLDTHAWVWIVEGDTRRVGPKARRLADRTAARGEIWISVASVFEVTALHTAGRLHLSHPVSTWIREALHSTGGRLTDWSIDIAIDAGSIPRDALADPLDRVLVASARQLDATFLTGDRQILAYARSTRSVRVAALGT